MGRSQPVMRSPDGSGSETSSGIFQAYSRHIRTYPDISGHIMIVAYERSRCRIACRRVCRVRDTPVPDRVPSGRSRAKGAGAGHVVGDGRRVRYGPLPDRVRYGPSPDRMPSHPGPPRRPHVSAILIVGRTEGPSSAMPRPNSACNRRRHRRLTNVYSFILPWRSLVARSAARLRRTVGPLASRKAVAGQTRQRDIIGHRPGLSGHIRTYPDITGQEMGVACGIVRRRIACPKVGRVRKEPVPDRVP